MGSPDHFKSLWFVWKLLDADEKNNGYRKSLPKTSTLIVAKNKLISKAIEGTKWEALKPAWLFVNSVASLFVHLEEIPAAIKPYRDLQKEFKLATDFTRRLSRGSSMGPKISRSWSRCPRKQSSSLGFLVVSKVLQPISSGLCAQGLARELVFTLKAYVAKLEEEAGQSLQ
ncbi:unnamed protein product [Calypogeia fissa]